MSFRKEEKLSLHPKKHKEFINLIQEKNGKILFPERTVSSTYFDNDYFKMYHDSNEGVVPRKKIRIRSYNLEDHSADNSKLEIKISSVENRFKIVNSNLDIKQIILSGYIDNNYGLCTPKLRVSYQRSYYIVNNLRITIDTDINYRKTFKNFYPRNAAKDELIIVEVKTNPSVNDDYILENFPLQKIRFSKYSRAVEFLKLI